MRLVGLLLFFLIVGTSSSYGQEDSIQLKKEKVIVLKNDLSTYTGYIIEDDAREILLESEEVGLIYIPKNYIKEIKPWSETPEQIEPPIETTQDTTAQAPTKTDTVATPDPVTEVLPVKKDSTKLQDYLSGKYIYSDNALPLRKGEGYIKVAPGGFEIGIPLTSNWSVAGFSSYLGAPAGIKTKYSFKLGPIAHLSVDLGYGSMAFGTLVFSRNIRDGAGFASTTLTIGDRSHNLSIKAGYAIIHRVSNEVIFDPITQMFIPATNAMIYDHLTFLNVGGMMKLSDFSSLFMEVTGGFDFKGTAGVAVGAAVRIGSNPRYKWQLGGSILFMGNSFLPVPVPHVSFSYVFSKRKPAK